MKHSRAVVGLEALARFECEPHRPPKAWFDEAAIVGRGAGRAHFQPITPAAAFVVSNPAGFAARSLNRP